MTPKTDSDSLYWQRQRKIKLKQHPLCEPCLYRTHLVSATVAELVIPPGEHHYGPLVRLVSMCEPCHRVWLEAAALGDQPLIKGCDEHGYPLDPRHPCYGHPHIKPPRT
jgi:hypothetical protein